MFPVWIHFALGLAALAGAVAWGRAALIRQRFSESVERTDPGSTMVTLATAGTLRDVHDLVVYLAVSAVAFGAAFTESPAVDWLAIGMFLPLVFTFATVRRVRTITRLAEERFGVERRAMELLEQAEVAPNRWAERLAPRELPNTPGYEIGHAHQAGSGVMSGDLMDVFQLPGARVCCVVGDAAGHGVEASMSALQTKFLLRTYLRRFRDPGQALEELNQQLMDYERPEDFVSICVVVFDAEAGTARYASAGHPPAWHYRDRSIRPLRSTGPVLMMDHEAGYISRDVEFGEGDLLVMMTDGLLEARNGNDFFGEERTAAAIRKTPDLQASVLCKGLLDAASDFNDGPILDDVTVMAVRRA